LASVVDAGTVPLPLARQRSRANCRGWQDYPIVLVTTFGRALCAPVLVTATMAKYQVPAVRLSISFVRRQQQEGGYDR
jgi:hypothetical protein